MINFLYFIGFFLVYITFMIFEFGGILNNQIKFHLSQFWDSSLLWSCNNQQEQ